VFYLDGSIDQLSSNRVFIAEWTTYLDKDELDHAERVDRREEEK
jgi:hypothetical protein